MLAKYNMMGLATALCTLLGVSSSNAAVTLTFEQVGSNVIATWSGTYALPEDGTVGSPPPFTYSYLDSNSLLGQGSGTTYVFGGGVAADVVASFPTKFGSYSGDTFGFGSLGLFAGAASGDYSPVGTMTFNGTTLSLLGADSFNNTLAYTGTGNIGGNREIRLTTIPEPSSAVLLGLGSLALAFRRRKN